MKKTGVLILSMFLMAGLCGCTSAANPLQPESTTESAAVNDSSALTKSTASETENAESEETDSLAEASPSQLISAESVAAEAESESTEAASAESTEAPSINEELAAASGAQTAEGTPAPGSTITANQAVFIRDNPDVDGSEIIGGVPGGASVKFLSETYGWYEIEYNGITGYSYGEFFN